MQEHPFDRFTRRLGDAPSRRTLLKLLAGSVIGGVGLSLGLGRGQADEPCPPGAECPDGSAAACPQGMVVCGGKCVSGTCCTDAQCQTVKDKTQFCDPQGHICRAKLGLGATGCAANDQCLSGVCSKQHVCSCPTGHVNCGGHCLTGSCCNDTDCAADHYCQLSASKTAAGTCRPRLMLGGACTTAEQCQSGSCQGNKCTCPQPMLTCGTACFSGTCCDDKGCAMQTGTFCSPTSHTCQPVGGPGSPCTAKDQCVSGICKNQQCACPAGHVNCSNNCMKGVCCVNGDCAAGQHCENNICKPGGGPGSKCTTGSQCDSSNCSSKLCCPSGLTNCKGHCVDLATDTNNCHACGDVCPTPDHANATCSMGACGITCAGGYTLCTGNCVDLESDSNNCGMCTTQCGASEQCLAGQCAVPNNLPCTGDGGCISGNCSNNLCCPSGATNCSNTCVDMTNDAANCGTCGYTCATTHATSVVCSAGTCHIQACAGNFADCDGDPATGCEAYLMTDAKNCGSCGIACRSAEQCVAGKCVDEPNGDPCSSNGECSSGNCVGGLCCPSGNSNCGNTCVNLAADPANCGACGYVCSAANATAMFCSASTCHIQICASGFADCDGNLANGCEANLSSVQTCGSCTNQCHAPANATPTCISGQCGFTCNSGYTQCGNACIPNGTCCSNNDCGFCQNCPVVGNYCQYYGTICNGACCNNGCCHSIWSGYYCC